MKARVVVALVAVVILAVVTETVEFKILRGQNRAKSSIATLDFRKWTLTRSGICSVISS